MPEALSKENKILIIDDDKVNNFICENILNELEPGFEVTCFTNPQLGMNTITTHKANIKLIFLDLNMPVYDGWSILEFLSSLEKTIPVVILTSSISPEDVNKSNKYKSVKGYLVKPATFDNIQYHLDDIIGKRHKINT